MTKSVLPLSGTLFFEMYKNIGEISCFLRKVLEEQEEITYTITVKGERKLSLNRVWRHMDRIERLKDMFMPVLNECDVTLYELNWLNGKDRILQVCIMKKDGTMDLDTCAAVSEKLSELLDASDPIDEEYTLEVCSPGAEREIRDLDELGHLTGAYVFLKVKEPVRKMSEITGEITAVTETSVTVEYRDKAVKRKAEIQKDNIAFIRMAVRI